MTQKMNIRLVNGKVATINVCSGAKFHNGDIVRHIASQKKWIVADARPDKRHRIHLTAKADKKEKIRISQNVMVKA